MFLRPRVYPLQCLWRWRRGSIVEPRDRTTCNGTPARGVASSIQRLIHRGSSACVISRRLNSIHTRTHSHSRTATVFSVSEVFCSRCLAVPIVTCICIVGFSPAASFRPHIFYRQRSTRIKATHGFIEAVLGRIWSDLVTFS